MYESISKNNELKNEMTLDMSYFLVFRRRLSLTCWSQGFPSGPPEDRDRKSVV